MIAADPALGGHASHTDLHSLLVGPVGPYFATGFNPVPVYISRDYVRAVRGGTGAAKTGGNYAASLFVGEEAAKKGYQQVLWLDAVERRYIEGGRDEYALVTREADRHPGAVGQHPVGISATRRCGSPDLGYPITEERLDVNTVLADIRSGDHRGARHRHGGGHRR
jgi:branched-chain amino acid aminotransferase